MRLRTISWVVVLCAVVLPACDEEASGSDDAGTRRDNGMPRGDAGPDGGTEGEGPVLPPGTLLYLRGDGADSDVIVAHDLASGNERVVTDLTEDGSSGWEIWGIALSPDRRRIAFASLFSPTSEDTATGLATRAIWTVATDGTRFRRLTPTVPNDAGGRSSFSHPVGQSEWTADGEWVVYDFGTYWWENGQLQGATFPSVVSSEGGAPGFPTTVTDCAVIYPSRNPVTGEFLFLHSACIPGQDVGNGIFLYPETGTTTPTQLVASAHVDGSIDVSLAKPVWFSDGSGFLFIGRVAATEWASSLFSYDAESGDVSLLITAPEGTGIESVALSPDATTVVYTLYTVDTNTRDLRRIDLTADPVTDTALTTDGISRDPLF